MAHDLVIRGGRVVDGTGGEPFDADVAIDGGVISAVGAVEATGAREIDARGHAVTPGFVDLHTHLDAQIGWDPMLTPVTWHGVTTALLGNCGVTFAPCRPGDQALLAGMMETVEDIPADAILNGLPWNWEGYGGYLDALEALNPAINVAGLVGHCAVRFYVMGERAVDEQPTEAERDRMAEVVGESISDGAAGFSTSRFLGHYLPGGAELLPHYLQPVFDEHKIPGGGMGALGHHGEPASLTPSTEWLLMLFSVLLALAGIAVAALLYARGGDLPQRMARGLGGAYRLARDRFRVDELYEAVILNPFYFLTRLSDAIDRYVVDMMVNAAAIVTEITGHVLKLLQTGEVRAYALSFFLGVLLILGYLVLA